ncbi:MAG: hypothetical protein FWC01_07525 [Treponema sp.]|nr:hypothetical protein [Treponema sp.]MCL2237711.1 hypothetical protein [Treponema sp.]
MKYENEALKEIHQGAIDKYKAGVITEARMSEFDEMCLKNPKIKKQVSSVYTDNDSAKIKITSHATA